MGEISVVKTKKNIRLRETLKEIGAKIIKETKDIETFRFENNLKNSDIVCISDERKDSYIH